MKPIWVPQNLETRVWPIWSNWLRQVPATGVGVSFAYHRELELYQQIGISPAGIVAWASYRMADYLGLSGETGSLEASEMADFFPDSA